MEKNKGRVVDLEVPESEIETPLIAKSDEAEPARKTFDITAKDSRAFILACICLITLALFCGVDVFVERDIIADSKMLEDFFEIVKYVITTSLGFFFATTIARK